MNVPSLNAQQLAQQAVTDANNAAAAMEQQAWDAASNSFLKSDLGKALKSAIEGAAGGAAALGAALAAGPLADVAGSALTAASAGAIAGSAIPLFGTVVGAMVGSIYALIKAFPPGEHGTWGGVIVPNKEFDQFAKFLGTEGFTKDAISKIKSKVPSSQWPLVRAWLYDSGNGSEFADAVAKGLGIPDVTSSSGGILVQASVDRAAGRSSYQTILNDAFQQASAIGPDVMQAVKDQWPPYGHFPSEKQPLSFPGVSMPGPSTFGPKLVSGFTPTGTAKPYVPSFGPNLSALPASFTPSFSMGSGMSVAQAATFLAANANNPQVKTVPPAAHVIVYSALTGAPEESSQASETILNATSAASSPNATPAQTALADALALAHKIQVHAQYVQKWFGPAEAAKYFNAGYITVQDLQ